MNFELHIFFQSPKKRPSQGLTVLQQKKYKQDRWQQKCWWEDRLAEEQGLPQCSVESLTTLLGKIQ